MSCSPKHVVFVTLDDVGVDKIGCYGHPTAGPTPTLDGLAAGGIRFSRAYVNPSCAPTRCCLLTGLYGSRTGVDTGVPTYNPLGDPNGDFVPSDELPWLARLLAAESVHCDIIGKWHLTHVAAPSYHQDPIAKGFHNWRGHLSNILVAQGEGLYSWTKQCADANGWQEFTCTIFATVDSCVDALAALSASINRRSLTWLAFNAPHPPWDQLPPSGSYTPVGGIQTQAKKQQYALQAVDHYLGQLMAAYAAQHAEAAAETLWIVLGDNGTPAAAVEQLPSHQHKATPYEGGVHVPLIAWGAGVEQPGRVDDRLVHAVDCHATLLELFGAPAVAVTDGISFAPALADPAAPPARAAVYARHAQPNGPGPKDWIEEAAIGPRWKLVRFAQGAAVSYALFDLVADPTELVSLYPPSTQEQTDAVAELQLVLDAGAGP